MIGQRQAKRRSPVRVSRRRSTSAPARARSLRGLGHPHLAPPGWAVGRPLAELMAEPLTSAEATAVTLAVLSALEELHRAGKHHGGVALDALGVGEDGWVRLAADKAVAWGSFSGDLAATGSLLCELLNVPAEAGHPGPTPEAERAAPALVAVARRLAAGTDWSAAAAWSAVHDAAGFLATEPQLVKALAELAERAQGTTEVEHAVAHVMPGPPPASPDAAGPPVRSAWLGLPRGVVRWLGFLAALVVIGALAGGVAATLAARPTAARTPIHAAAPKPAANATPAQAPPAQSLYAPTPSAAVQTFFEQVQAQRLDQAALLWTPNMATSADIQAWFGGVQSLTVKRADVVSVDPQSGTATVAVEWSQTASDGSMHEYQGDISLVSGALLWRWDGWSIQEVTQPSPGGGGGDDGG